MGTDGVVMRTSSWVKAGEYRTAGFGQGLRTTGIALMWRNK